MTEDELAQERLESSVILKTYEGRRMVWRILEQCGIYRTSFSSDAGEMAFREGQRSVGLWVLAEIVFTSGPDMFSMMAREAEDRLKNQKEEELKDD